jgi:succinate dehydrogenase/fumarate reductase flavoprotein subunit
MTRWDHEADVIIVGGGAAGLAAAAAALAAGASVAVLDAAELGGTTRRSGGAFWIPNNSFLRRAGVDDPRDAALALMARLAYPSLYVPDRERFGLTAGAFDLLAAYYDHGAEVIDALIAAGALDPVILPQLGASPGRLSDPDYHAELLENRAPYGRVLTAQTPPGALVWPGVPLTDGLIAHARAAGATLLPHHRVTDVIVHQHGEHHSDRQGEVIGVEARHGGRGLALRARRGVVFASGGFSHDRRKVLSFLRGPIFGTAAVPDGDGAFLEIATRLGAQLGNLAGGFYFQIAVEAAVETGGAVARPDAFVFLPYGDSTILTNLRGRRIVNEKAMYHERAQSHFVHEGGAYPNLVQLMIWDEAVAREPTFWPWRGALPLPGADSPFVIHGDTLPALAAAIDARLESLRGRAGLSAAIGPDVRLAPDFAATLAATLARFADFARTGKDLDFHRGETPIELAWQGPSRGGPNRTMHALSETGPYHAMLLGAGLLDTCGGPVIDACGHVVRPDGSPIPGLYAAGNAAAAPSAAGYWGAGGTIGPALVFGYLAGQHAARRAPGG